MKIAKDIVGEGMGALMVAALGGSGTAQTGYKWEGNLAGDVHEQMGTSYESTRIDLPSNGLYGPRGNQGNLADDMVNTGAAGGLPVRDGGSIFVDLDGENELEVTVLSALDEDPIGVRPDRRARGPRVRLFGGQPGNAGGVVVSLDRPHRDRLSPMSGGLMSGTFDASGSFEVELPYTVGEAWVQGFTVSKLGAKFTPVRRLGAEEEEPSYDETSISNAVHGALKAGDAAGKKSLHFFGAAKSGKLDGWVDLEVELSRAEKGTFHLSMDREIAEATQIVAAGGDDKVTVQLYSEAEVASAIEDLALLQAFANDPHASAKLFAQRSVLAGSVLPPRCGTQSLNAQKGLFPMADPTRWVERTVGEEGLGAEVGASARIPAGRGIRKNEPEVKTPHAAGFDGPIQDEVFEVPAATSNGPQTFPASEPAKTVSKFTK